MKVKLNKVAQSFKPISIFLEIETPEELCNLWHRLNMNVNTFHDDDIYSDSDRLEYEVRTSEGILDLWNIIDDHVKYMGLNKR